MSQAKKIIRFDWAMKNILRDKANFDVLEGFLTDLLNEEIKIENLLESETNKEYEDDKLSRVDLLCLDSKGRNIIIEIQNSKEFDFFPRILFGAFTTACESLKMGGKYGKIRKVISISLLFHPISSMKRRRSNHCIEYIHMEHRVNNRDGEILNNESRIVNYFPKHNNDEEQNERYAPEFYLVAIDEFDDKIKSSIDEWLYIFKNEEIREDFKSKGVLIASKKLDFIKLTNEEKKRYRRFLDNQNSFRDAFKINRDEGLKEGIEKGIKEGLEKGIKEGLEKGLKEGVEKGLKEGVEKGLKEGIEKGRMEGEAKVKIELVKNLLDLLDDDTIALKSGLSIEVIKNLRKNR